MITFFFLRCVLLVVSQIGFAILFINKFLNFRFFIHIQNFYFKKGKFLDKNRFEIPPKNISENLKNIINKYFM